MVVQTSHDSKVGSGMYMASLLQVAAGEYIGVTAARSKEKTQHGNYLTFVSLKRWNGSAWTDVAYDKHAWAGESWADKHDEVTEDFRKHPAYKEYEREDADGDDGSSPVYTLLEAIRKKGWPEPLEAGNVDAYVSFAAKLADRKIEAITDLTDEEAKEITEFVQGAKKAPAIIAALA